MTKTRGTTLASAVAAVAVAVGMLASPAAIGAKRKPSCEKGQEQQGCVLKRGQRYTGRTDTGPRSTLALTTRRNGVQLRFEGRVQCEQGGEPVSVQVRFGPPLKGKPKVGRSYPVDIRERIGANDEGVEYNALKGRVTLRSAKTATARLTYTYTAGTRTGCTAKVRFTLKRALGG